jgi:protein required for attachment to host cells
MRLPHDALVLVADGENELVLTNHGDADLPDLRVVSAATRPTRRNAETYSDRPGRYPAPGARRETVEQTDWRRIAKTRFAEEIARRLNGSTAPAIVVLADPRTLGAIRGALTDATRARIVAEIPISMSHATIPAIEAEIARV